MAKTRQDFTLWTGDSLTVEITVTGEDGDPASLAGAEFEWELWRSQRDAAYQPFKGSGYVLRKTSDGGGITAAGSTVSIALSPADTEELPGGLYYHELQVTQSGVVSTPTTGQVTVIKTAISSVP